MTNPTLERAARAAHEADPGAVPYRYQTIARAVLMAVRDLPPELADHWTQTRWAKKIDAILSEQND